MPVLTDWSLMVDADAVLRGQGADPLEIRRRSPRLLEIAQRAIDDAAPLLTAIVLYERLPVESLRHEEVRLAGGRLLKGALLAQHLAPASEVILVLCTVGEAVETYASEVGAKDIVYGLALDGVGSAGVEALATAVCASFEAQATEAGLQTSIPLSPGMLGWPVELGQRQVFAILEPAEVGVRLMPSMQMIPQKSLTFVLGVGVNMIQSARTCDYCSLKETCRYQNSHV